VGRGVPVIGDIELFAWALQRHGRQACKVLAVTGTNGKTTVTSLAGHLMRRAGLDAEVAGNIGPPVLDALVARLEAGKLPQAWVLELSSYQLETTWSLAPDAAAMLNLSEDHLDRYPGLAAYAAAKARVFAGARVQVVNRDDAASLRMGTAGVRQMTFGLGPPPEEEDFGTVGVNGTRWIAQGRNPLAPITALRISGWHNVANAMAAMALARAVGVCYAPMVEAITSFRGLPHRLEKVASVNGVDYYDDSKGTNVGATIAALEGLGGSGPTGAAARPIVLIAGGVGKGQDFAPLAHPVATYARRVLLIGEDAGRIETAISESGVPVERCGSLEQAVEHAQLHARPGDAVLLSPACASFDMFRDYKHRGEAFTAAARALGGQHD